MTRLNKLSFHFFSVVPILKSVDMLNPLALSATMLAAQTIQLGINDFVVAGGMESMSNAPKYLAAARLVCVSTQISS